MTPTILPVAGLAALFGVDVVSFPQAMLSRPIVAATISGAAFGSPARGLIIGALLECLALETLPFGASRYPEWGSASVVGGALFAAHGAGHDVALVGAASAAVLTAALGGWSMVWHRRMLGRLTHRVTAGLARGSTSGVAQLQLGGLVADAVRGAIVAAVSFAVATPIMQRLTASAAPWLSEAGGGAVAVAGAIGLAAVWRVSHGTTRATALFAAGLAIAALLLVLT